MCTHEECGRAVTGTGPALGLMVCARCKNVAYCSKLCQKVHWKREHKHTCNELSNDHLEIIRNILLSRHVDKLWSKSDLRAIVEMKLEILEAADTMRSRADGKRAYLYMQLGISLVCMLTEKDKNKRSYIVSENDESVSDVGIVKDDDKSFAGETYTKEAFEILEKSIAIHEEIYREVPLPKNMECLCFVLGETAILYRNQFLFGNAISLHERLLSLRGGTEISEIVCRTKSQLGELYYFVGDNEKAYEILKESEEVAFSIRDGYSIAGAKMGLAGFYAKTGEYEKAINIGSESLVIYERLGKRVNIRNATILIADCMTRSGDFKNAMELNKKGMSMALEVQNLEDEVYSAAKSGITLLWKFLSENRTKIRGLGGDIGLFDMDEDATCSILEIKNFLVRACGHSTCIDVVLETNLHLSCVHFLIGEEYQAIGYMTMYMRILTLNARKSCGGCRKTRNDDTVMLSCAGCKVIRFLFYMYNNDI